ncbi:MAG: glutathione S-transferase family protein [Gammaproteobacteria bacterium]|nr:glutathione S-transferase family protein [Gammaproteobacteria bacterium]
MDTSRQLKLISHRLCPYVQRARIVLNEKRIPHDIEFIDLDAKPDWFLAVSPLGKVPVLLVDGEPLFESAAIIEFLDETTPGSLHPAGPLERARHRAWIEFASGTLNTIAGLYSARNLASFETNLETLAHRFSLLEDVIDRGPYFRGQQFSLVDAAFAPVFRYFDVIESHLQLGLFTHTPWLRIWRRALRERASVRGAVVADYPDRLYDFLLKRQSVLAHQLEAQASSTERLAITA